MNTCRVDRSEVLAATGCRAVAGMVAAMTVGCLLAASEATSTARSATWQVGTPIVTYWAGPPLTEPNARQMAEGGWNLVWCNASELDMAQKHGLRGQLTDGLLSPAALQDPAQRQKLDTLIDRVRQHPALYAYFITDEPNTTNFPALGELVRYLRARDPAHLAYINLFPTYASNEQLGNKGGTVAAYQAHLSDYLRVVKPALISYDHYQLAKEGDNPQYFLNLALIRRAALEAGLPFLNIVQACTWTPSMRVPTPDEMRYLVYTTLAYGAQGISYYVYCCQGHTGAIANADGTPTPLYHALKVLNREFVAIARELQPLASTGVYHAGMLPPGAEPLPENAPFALAPPVKTQAYVAPKPVKGVLLGCFGASDKPAARPSHVVVVNLDYQAEATLGLRGPAPLEVFSPTNRRWSPAGGARAELRLPRGGGVLLRTPR